MNRTSIRKLVAAFQQVALTDNLLLQLLCRVDLIEEFWQFLEQLACGLFLHLLDFLEDVKPKEEEDDLGYPTIIHTEKLLESEEVDPYLETTYQSWTILIKPFRSKLFDNTAYCLYLRDSEKERFREPDEWIVANQSFFKTPEEALSTANFLIEHYWSFWSLGLTFDDNGLLSDDDFLGMFAQIRRVLGAYYLSWIVDDYINVDIYAA